MKDVLLYSGTSNPLLARQVAKRLNLTLGDVEITRFIDNECRVFVKDSVTGAQVFVLQSLSEVADQHLVELCLLGQAMKNMKATGVTAVIPWMGYSKQDKAFRKGEAVSAQLVAKFIEAAGFTRVITCELHSENLLPFFTIPVVELSTHTLLAEALFAELKERQHLLVVSPDKGGVSRSEAFARTARIPIAYLTKTRDVVSGTVTVSAVSEDVAGKDCIIFDDIINTGATAIKTSEYLKARGAGKVYFLATHGILAGHAAEDLKKSLIDRMIITDTVAVPRQKQFDKLRIISVAPLIVDAISAGVR